MALIDADSVRQAYSAAQLIQLSVLLRAGVSLVVRLRRAGGQERQQLKWFAYVSAVGSLLITGVVCVTDQPVIVAVFWFPAVAVAIGVAIFKYRLHDIDRTINRTLICCARAGFRGRSTAERAIDLGWS